MAEINGRPRFKRGFRYYVRWSCSNGGCMALPTAECVGVRSGVWDTFVKLMDSQGNVWDVAIKDIVDAEEIGPPEKSEMTDRERWRMETGE